MSFSEQLRNDAEPLFDAIYRHPFIQDIAHERLSGEAIVHYVQQDIQYLETYARVYGMALTKSRTLDQMQFFHKLIGVVLGGELTPHLNLCKVAGVSYEDLHGDVPLAPTADHYAKHMITAAYTGQLADIVAAVLPCHWTYVDLAHRIVVDYPHATNSDHAFCDWISFYASDAMSESLRELTDLLDRLVEEASPADLIRIEAIFEEGCRLEYRFFDMAYRQERW